MKRILKWNRGMPDYMRWTCSDFVNHQHRFKWTAWICGRVQASKEAICDIMVGAAIGAAVGGSISLVVYLLLK